MINKRVYLPERARHWTHEKSTRKKKTTFRKRKPQWKEEEEQDETILLPSLFLSDWAVDFGCCSDRVCIVGPWRRHIFARLGSFFSKPATTYSSDAKNGCRKTSLPTLSRSDTIPGSRKAWALLLLATGQGYLAGMLQFIVTSTAEQEEVDNAGRLNNA